MAHCKVTAYRVERKFGVVILERIGEQGDRIPIAPAASLAVYSHSPTGFECGYGGSGPAQLALAILLDAGFGPKWALRLHQDFKWDFVTAMSRSGGLIPIEAIDNWARASGAVRHSTPGA